MRILIVALVILLAMIAPSTWPRPHIVAEHGDTTWWMNLHCPPGFRVNATWRGATGNDNVDSAHWVNDAQVATCVVGREVPPQNHAIEPDSGDR